MSSVPSYKFNYQEYVNIGVIHTLLSTEAWKGGQLPMQQYAANHCWAEIERAFKQFTVSSDKPDIILIPEVSVPRYRLAELKKLASGLGAVVIAGLDFDFDGGKRVVNQAAVIVPSRWPQPVASNSARAILVGKTYPSQEEDKHFKSLSPRAHLAPDPILWLFDAEHLGRFGVCLCFDFMDVDRPPLYRGEIHHLFVLAHNKDVTSFAHIAESLCRTVYCNVIVCNSGWFGGSVAITPYFDHFRRPVYQVLGNELSSSQVIKIPVKAMEQAIRHGKLTKNGQPFLKALPPGFQSRRP